MGKGSLSRYEKRQQRKENQQLKKAKQKSLIAKMERNWDAKDLSDLQGMTWKDKVSFVLLSSWIINEWYEKLLLLGVIFLALWRVLNFFGWFCWPC